VPQLVVIVDDEAELTTVVRACHARGIPFTFRAAGTSLSGQAISDSVLVKLGPGWRGHRLGEGAETISLQPGIIGAHANRILAPYQRKIGPDPASINACMIGGIAANNASGMQTLVSMRVVLADGTLLDTADTASRGAFRTSHGALLDGLAGLASEVRTNPALVERIRHKFKIKNTTGYSLNALVDYDDPFEILQHLMIGSEGTLGFIAEITYRTVPEHPHKASALVFFPDIETACDAVTALKPTPVSAVELIDRAGLRSVEDQPGLHVDLKGFEAQHPPGRGRGGARRLRDGAAGRVYRQAGGVLGPVEHPQGHSRTSRFRSNGSVPQCAISRCCSRNTATTRRSCSVTRSRATCTSSSRRISAMPPRSRATPG
jgi:D-lactate dehydrogenase